MRLPLTALLLFALSLVLSAQDTRIYVVTHVDVTPNYANDAAKLLLQYAADSRKDMGSVRFELLGDLSRKNHFTFVSVWENQAAFNAHLEANHAKQFRDKLQPMLGSPFDERLHSIMQ
ncbi:MAG: putative quinol monooxygenase [Bryobacteraceae bacterium]|jgi:quinol monooxygenase YgiN